MSKFLGLLGFLISVGCASSTLTSSALNEPLNAINSAVESGMKMGIQKYSENHREFYSRPFQVPQSDELRRLGLRERGSAKVTILGDQRPYTIETEVVIERGKIQKKNEEINYSFDRYDKGLAKKLLSNILSILERRGYEKNVIDDFRPF